MHHVVDGIYTWDDELANRQVMSVRGTGPMDEEKARGTTGDLINTGSTKVPREAKIRSRSRVPVETILDHLSALMSGQRRERPDSHRCPINGIDMISLLCILRKPAPDH